ncbi:hypothetical protein HAZT_HAZT004683 [Hyalella azteca]|uniref:NTF2-related export protein n=1 Tax=Hyalella azteca TaxID=294128 RepID=A0A6A0GUI2_HYAAZ|nr:hypothetical protein HAZT_HAZT004683 [Hyalella azteca]
MEESLKVTRACVSGSEFIKLYYDSVDKMRHKLAKLYLSDAELIWNGNRLTGDAAIQKFYEELPVSQHTVRCFDSQPVSARAVGDQTSLLITTAGFVFFKGKRSDFTQSFLITCFEDKWKVVSDCFRFQQFIT